MSQYSLNEIEAVAKKAARGAGYTWGLAEEAGKAVRWLCARDADGCTALADLIVRFDGAVPQDITPNPDGTQWQASSGILCPLMMGCILSDHARLSNVQSTQIGPIAEPILLLPFAANWAKLRNRQIGLEWVTGQAVTDGTAFSMQGHMGRSADQITMHINGKMAAPSPRRTRVEPAPMAWETLTSFAHRTYAPATEESRMKGAG